MSDIETLQQRVVEAEERFGLIAEQRAKYSERLLGLITAIETRLVEQQAEIERQAGEVASQGEELELRRQDSAENKLLRGMLHSLLSAIEAGSRDTLSETMQAMDAKVSALLAGNAPTATPEAAAPMDEPESETLKTEAEEADPGPQDEDPEVVASPPAAEAPEPSEAAMPEPETSGADDPSDNSEAPAEEENLAPEIALPDPIEEPSATDGALEPDPLQEPVALDGPEGAAETPAEPETLAAAAHDAGDLSTGETGAGEAETAMTGDEPAAGTPVEDIAETQASDLPETLEAAEPPEVLDGPEGDAEMPAEPETLAAAVVQDAGDVAAENGAAAEVEAAEPPEVPAETAAGAGLEDLIEEDAAVPGVSTAGDAGGETSDATSLEDIMRRVSKLVEEEGALGPLSAGGVRIEAEAEAPDSETPEPAAKAASNG